MRDSQNSSRGSAMKVLVVGGSGGIGAATVRCLIGEGHEVFFTYQSNIVKAAELEKATSAQRIHYDFSSEASAEKVLQRLLAKQ